MGPPGAKLPPPRRATYADLEAVPANQVAELIEGTLYVMPRPAPSCELPQKVPVLRTAGVLELALYCPFKSETPDT